MKKFALFNLFFTLIVITLGALTRLLDAGLGCPDWPVCYGAWVPTQEQAHTVFTLWAYDEGKAWMEMIHRYAASALGLFIFIQAILLWPRTLGAIRIIAIFLCGWIIVQGLFGMWTVTLRLWPPVVTGHLLGGVITIGAQFLIWRLIQLDKPIRLQPVWLLLAVVLFVQMGLGAWTSSHYAGLACPDFPTCQGNWWVEIDRGILHSPQVEGDEYLGGLASMKQRMGIQWVHRLGALAVLLSFMLVLARTRISSKPSMVFSILLITQIALGILNAIWLLPLSLALLHNTVAMLLWLAALNGMTSQEKYHGKNEPIAELVV